MSSIDAPGTNSERQGGDMAESLIAATRPEPVPHEELTAAHHEACKAASALRESLTQRFSMNITVARRQAIELGAGLERAARAERACSRAFGAKHKFTSAYQAMLNRHRLAFLDFEKLSLALETDQPLDLVALARVATDIDHHLTAAEQIHKECMAEAA